MSEIQTQTLSFTNGNKATAVSAPIGTKPQQIVDALSLPIPKTLIVAIGGADDFDPAILPRLTQLYRSGVGRAAIDAGALIIDGGTQAGVMSLIGQGVAACGNQTAVLGVAPSGKIKLPNDSEGEGTPLEPNHTHFIITEGNDWGTETPVLFDLVRWLTKGSKAGETEKSSTGYSLPVVAVLSGGGTVSRQEVLRVVRQNIPLIVVEGSGGFADEIAAACKAAKDSPVDDPDMAEIIGDGELHFHQLSNSVRGIERLIIRELGTDKVLMQAWETFADYDLNAKLQQKKFNKIQLAIVVLGVLGTALVVVQQVFAPRDHESGNLLPVKFAWDINLLWFTIYYLLILIPILLTVLITAANRFKQGSKWLLLRAGAESIKREIYSYRVRDISDRITAEQLLAKRVEDITRRTMQTEVNLSALKPYDKAQGFPPDMYASDGGDDGFSLLSPERYVEVRLGDQLRYYSKTTVRLEKQLRLLSWSTFVIGGVGAFLAAIGQQAWIALTTSLVAALGTYLGYKQTENSLTKYNQTATDLRNIKGWWNALSAEEQANNENIASLVEHTEKVLQTELDGWIQQMQNALAELRKNQEAAAAQKQEAQQQRADDDGGNGNGGNGRNAPVNEQPPVQAKDKKEEPVANQDKEETPVVTTTVKIIRSDIKEKPDGKNGADEDTDADADSDAEGEPETEVEGGDGAKTIVN